MDRINKYGLTFFETSTDSEEESYLIAKELIEKLFFNMSKLCTKFCNDFFVDLPYTYRERQLDCVILPALAKLCNSMVFTELPSKRFCNNRHFQVDEYNGWIDYWCLYKNYSFVIELKHSYDCFSNPITDTRTTKRWIEMNKQLESSETQIKDFGEKTKRVVRIGLHIITSKLKKEPSNQIITEFNNSISSTFDRLQKDLQYNSGKRYPTYKPDLIICWKIPPKIVMEYDETYPGLWAITKICKAIKHKGAIEGK